MTDYKSTFELIDQTSDKYKISNLLTPLGKIEPNEAYLGRLKELTNKVFEVKTDAINLLSHYNSSDLEDFFIKKLNLKRISLLLAV